MAAPQQQMFGILLPGLPVRTDIQPADQLGSKFTLTVTLSEENLRAVSDLVFFLLPGAVLPPGHGAVLYWQVATAAASPMMAAPAASGFDTLGAIVQERPSAIFRTGWGQNESVLSAMSAAPGAPVAVTLGISIEPVSNIVNLGIAGRGVGEDRTNVAKKIAQDLYNYLKSFDLSSFQNDTFMVPSNVFERWLRRFEAKSRVDPNFFLKESS